MYGVILVVILILTGGVIAFIGDHLGSKVGKKKLSLFGMRPKHTSILVTIITGFLITTVSIGIMAVASKDVRTALFGMEKLKTEMANTQRYLNETSAALNNVKKDLNSTKEEYADSKKELEISQKELEQAKQAADSMRREQQLLQNKNQELWAANSSLTADNNDLLASNGKLKESNKNLEILNRDLQEGIENMREKPIIYRVGELLASGVIKKTGDAAQIQSDLNEITALANSKIIDRLGEAGAKNGVWIYPAEYQKALETLKNAQGDTVVRLIVAANLVKGDPVLTDLELHPNRIVYQKDELVYVKQYDIAADKFNTEQLISDFLRSVNMQAVKRGILPNPLTGAVGVINGNQIYSIEKALQEASGNISVSAYAVKDTDVLGPLRLNIILKRDDDLNGE